ncbi:hypothetical protein [Crocosphaera sp.]|uniref:hypothetical protein n=1 Tax=Crocosphaera sp. TaxID=2729996 RepID=UPI00263743AA|nr:hypothetical protein [Crocosphaera sp.]MDJ0579204.1 hypothetical protein [Crocosphaera sp.]
MIKSPKQQKGSEIRMIGPRGSGKTTYLATLAYCPKGLREKYPGLKFTPYSEDAEKLVRLAGDILKNGAQLAGTRLYDDNLTEQIQKLPYYDFQLTIPKTAYGPSLNLELSARDFPGEFFEKIAHPSPPAGIELWFDDLFSVTGWMVMMTDWQPGRDQQQYYPAFKKLCEEITNAQEIQPALKNLKIAVVMAKCERGELWTGRKDPDLDLFQVRLPKTYNYLTDKFGPKRLQFFACSSFGVLGDSRWSFDPRPNRYTPDDGSLHEYNAFLRNGDQWYPYGLIPPLYWLATGKRIEE